MKYTKPGVGFIVVLIILLSVAIVDKISYKTPIVDEIKIESRANTSNTMLASKKNNK